MLELKNELIDLIKEGDIQRIKSLIKPDVLGNAYVMQEINKIAQILLTDRNNNGKLELEDLVLIKGDMMAISSLVSSILIILSQVTNLKYKEDETEELIFKLLVYIFLIIVPEKSNMKMSKEEKIQIIEISLGIYQIIKSSHIAKQIIQKVKKWIYSKCCMSEDDKEEILKAKLIKEKTKLHFSINNIKLENQVNKL